MKIYLSYRLCALFLDSIKDMYHERAFSRKADVYSTQVRIIVETLDAEHTDRVEAALRAIYRDVHRGGLT